MKNKIIQELKTLSKDDLFEVKHVITDLLDTRDKTKAEEFMTCPYCKSNTVIKFGHRNNLQRYKCKACNKIFTTKSTELYHCSKISIEQWKQFIDYEISGMTLVNLSYFTKLSVTTCFRLRHKLYAACSKYLESIQMKGHTELDMSFQKINLKGTKPQNMPRASKKRGGRATYSGISHHTVAILVAIDENDNHFMKVAGLGSESFEKYRRFDEHFRDSDLIISDSRAAISQFANHLKIENDKIPTNPNYKRYTTNKGNSIQDINEFAKCIKDITHDKHGISIRYLNGYLAFCCIRKMIHYSSSRKDNAEAFMRLISNNSYKSIVSVPLIPVDLKEAYWEFNYGIYHH